METSIKLILMLEDDLERIRRFKAVVARHHAYAVLTVARTAHDFVAKYKALAAVPDLICLDHDLFVDSPDDSDRAMDAMYPTSSYTNGAVPRTNSFDECACR